MLCHHCGSPMDGRICTSCGAEARLHIRLGEAAKPVRERISWPLLALLCAALAFMGVVDVCMLRNAQGPLWHWMICAHMALLATALLLLLFLTIRRR